MANGRPVIPNRPAPLGKAVDPVKARNEAQAALDHMHRMMAFHLFGDLSSPTQPASPPEQGVTGPNPPKGRRISSQGLAKNTGKSNTTI